MQGMKAQNIRCVLGKSFARIFHRSCINLGLPIITQADAAAAATRESEIRVDVDGGEVVVDGQQFETETISPFMQDMLSSGGLVPWGRERLDAEK